MSANDTARTPEPFVYRLKAVAKVVDGDTVDLDLDLGLSINLRQRCVSMATNRVRPVLGGPESSMATTFLTAGVSRMLG